MLDLIIFLLALSLFPTSCCKFIFRYLLEEDGATWHVIDYRGWLCSSMMELQQDHCRTLVQADRLKRALDDHSLELRVKAANEAEAACQQRLAAAEAEIAEHRQRLDDSERCCSSLWISFMMFLFKLFRL
jgi:hypothetical protein